MVKTCFAPLIFNYKPLAANKGNNDGRQIITFTQFVLLRTYLVVVPFRILHTCISKCFYGTSPISSHFYISFSVRNLQDAF